EIIENLEAVGMILPLVTKTNYPAGQSIPVDNVKPVASWVGEGKGSNAQKKSKLGSILFGSHKLRCEIAMTQEVTVQTLPSFERLFVKQVSEAMVKAIESKILSDADGSAGTPTGIFYNANESTNPDKVVEIDAGSTGILDYAVLCQMEAELPQQYESNAKWFMTKKTFMQFQAMVDNNNQPIARIDHDITGKPERVLLGREVILCGDYMESLKTTVTKDTVVACLFDMSDYTLNTSYDLGIQSKIDWDNEDHKTKAVMSVDGKVVDRGSLVKLVKKAAAAS
ncbi:MAG: phage major capsid protein, partial [Oscillospiraceae bacterium]|nr:phage major capsid protein [Oscillospiraceae bacterium]